MRKLIALGLGLFGGIGIMLILLGGYWQAGLAIVLLAIAVTVHLVVRSSGKPKK